MFDAYQPVVLAFFVVAAVAIAAAVVGLVIAYRDSRAAAPRSVVAFGARTLVDADARRAA